MDYYNLIGEVMEGKSRGPNIIKGIHSFFLFYSTRISNAYSRLREAKR